MRTLNLPTSYESIRAFLQAGGAPVVAKLMEFVSPVTEAEETIARLSYDLRSNVGRLVFLLGPPGIGKSTFIASLEWRKHVGVSSITSINCADFAPKTRLDELFARLQDEAKQAREARKSTAVSVDYLESLDELEEKDIKAFFRSLNGILRNAPLFVVWPVVDRRDAERMVKIASAVSGTMFSRGEEIVAFSGPSRDRFASIAKSTISVLNDGKTLEDFNLTDADLDTLRETSASMREYLEAITGCWRERARYVEDIRKRIPKPTEVWFVFGYPGAEDVASQFARKSDKNDEAWTAFHNKLWEYIPNTQKRARWDPKRLQLAIGGTLTTRILYLPTNTLVSCVAAYGSKAVDAAQLEKNGLPDRWKKKSTALESIETTVLYRLLKGLQLDVGKRRSGPAAEALRAATQPFDALGAFVTGNGNDRHANAAISLALVDALGEGFVVEAEKTHPWIPNITPDIRIDTPNGKHISLEFCYTRDKRPNKIANYALEKLDDYMVQLEGLVS